MDRFEKFLRSQRKADRVLIAQCVARIVSGDFQNLDIKPLSGLDNFYRCRKGDIRIIFRIVNDRVQLIDVDFRKDVYKRLKH
jgi:mRNA-degrading endonuclease RelE of RelBE toxin-antitoxin system